MPIALSTCVKDYLAVYRNPKIVHEGRYDLVRIIRWFEEANRAGTSLQAGCRMICTLRRWACRDIGAKGQRIADIADRLQAAAVSGPVETSV